ncbi:hypothetical protein [Candidatus Electronema sp. TJ]|uniref:hypothetical protein n=1 Tax=Candidatus Electronema sp. TJ TaxID=3401573 RepID=UPI003AA81A8C
MARQYIITVGASLLEAPCFQGDIRLETLAANDELLDLKKRQEVKNKTKELLSACGDDINKFLQKNPFNRELWEKDKYHLLGAELATLRRIHNANYIQDDDILHLFASKKNTIGGRCGSLLELILKDIFPACSITLHHFEQLDAEYTGCLKVGLKEAYRAAQEIISGTKADTWLVLSGGYKAVVMMLAQLQMTHDRITVASLHEDTNEGFLSLPSVARNIATCIRKADQEPDLADL